MKHYIHILLLLVPMLMSSCADELYQEYLSSHPMALSADVQSCTFDARTSKAQTINVKTTATRWTLENPATDWVKLSATSGNASAAVDVTVAENLSAESRTAVLNLKSQEGEYPVNRPISITQNGATPYIIPAETSAIFSGSKQDKAVNVESNVDWTCSSNQQWITAKREDNSLKLSVTENTGSSRNANISLSFDGKTYATVSVTQNAAGVTATPQTLDIDVKGETKDVQIAAEAAWTASVSTAAQSWITLSTASAQAGNTTLKVTVATNGQTSSRSGEVYIKFGSTTKCTINVTQASISINTSPTSLNIAREGETKTIAVTANCDWTAQETYTDGSAWLTLKKTANGLEVQATANPEDTKREAKINFKCNGTTLRTVNVTQDGVVLNVDGTPIFKNSSKPQTATVTLTANTNWTATSSNPEWLTVSPSSGSATGSATITVAVTDNNTTTARTGSITFKAGNATHAINIEQSCRTLALSKTTLNISAAGDSETVDVETEGVFEAVKSTDAEWLTVAKNGNTITLTATKNESGDNRQATVTVRLTDLASGKLEQTLNVTQRGKEGSITIEDFDSDEDWNVGNGETTPTDTGSSNVDKDGYGDDEDWNPEG